MIEFARCKSCDTIYRYLSTHVVIPPCPRCEKEKNRCTCVVKNRNEGESEEEWVKRWMCVHHWKQTDYYRKTP